MPLTWPDLPAPEGDGYQDDIRDNSLRTLPDMGAEMVRRATTGTVRDVRFMLYLSSAQRSTLETFYLSTTAHGSLPFQFPNPWSGYQAVNAMFAGPPKAQKRSGDRWAVTVSLVLPP